MKTFKSCYRPFFNICDAVKYIEKNSLINKTEIIKIDKDDKYPIYYICEKRNSMNNSDFIDETFVVRILNGDAFINEELIAKFCFNSESIGKAIELYLKKKNNDNTPIFYRCKINDSINENQ